MLLVPRQKGKHTGWKYFTTAWIAASKVFHPDITTSNELNIYISPFGVTMQNGPIYFSLRLFVQNLKPNISFVYLDITSVTNSNLHTVYN
jgi:hypothetical protein